MKLKLFTTLAMLLIVVFCSRAQDSITVTLKIIENSEYNIEKPVSEADVTVKIKRGQDVYPNLKSDNEGKVIFKLPKDAKTYSAILKKVSYITVVIDLIPSNDETITQTMQSSESIADIEPIDIYDSEQLLATGRINLGDALHFLVPSIYNVPQTVADLTDHVTPTTMKGLSTDQVLLLLNGKRVHSSALVHVNGSVGRGNTGFDINTIPLAAIDRVEIYRAGASVRFGSDAIAGVINIILKGEESKEGSTSFSVLSSTTTGERNDNDSGEGRATRVSGNVGLPIVQNDTRKGYINLSGEYVYYGPINRSGDTRDFLGLDDTFYEQVESDLGLRNGRIMKVGKAETEDYQVVLNSRLLLSDNAEFYTTGYISNRIGESFGFYRLPSQADRIGLSAYENGFLPGIRSGIFNQSITSGLALNKNAWTSEVSHTISSNRIDISVFDSNNASLGEDSPTQFEVGAVAYNQGVTNIDFSGKLSDVWTLNLGGAIREERYQLFAGEESSFILGSDTSKVSGAQVFPGYRPENEVNETRLNTGFYAFADVEISENLTLSFGSRIENYRNLDFKFDKNVILKAAIKYAFNDNLIVRGSYNEGFRVPSLHQTFFSNINTQSGNEVITFNNQGRFQELLGIPNLSPESSKNLNVGFTGNFEDFNFSVDGYWIDIEDRVIFSSEVPVSSIKANLLRDSLDNLTLLNLFDDTEVNGAQFFINAENKTRTLGIDANFNIPEIPIGKYTLAILLGGTWNRNTLEGTIIVPSQLEGLEGEIFNKEEISRLEVVQPQWKALANAQFDTKSWFNARLRVTIFGEMKYITEDFDQTFDPTALADLEVGGKWQLKDKSNLSVSIGVNNILETYPNEQSSDSPEFSENRFPYSRRTRQFLESGTTIYARLTFTL